MIATDTQERIADIEKVLLTTDDQYESMGLNNGLLGLSLFYYHCYVCTQNENYLNKLTDYISLSFKGLNDSYTGFSGIHDIMEIGSFLHFLQRKEILLDDLNDYLSDADTVIGDFLEKTLQSKNIDPIAGCISAGYYFLNRLDTKPVNAAVEQIVDLIDILAVHEKNALLFWYNNFHDEKKQELQLGFMHGMAGIVNFLLSVYEKGVRKEKSKLLAKKALNFLLKHKCLAGCNLFPFDALTNERLDYQNLCYGDLGIGYVFLRAGKLFKDPDFHFEGIEIIENASLFRDDSQQYITDANLLYGAAGLHSFFKLVERTVDSILIREAGEYWLDKVIHLNNQDTPWVGYRSSFNNHTVATQLCFSEGIGGIGITLMCHQQLLKYEFLSFFNYKALN